MTAVFGYMRFSFFGKNDTLVARNLSDDQERFDALYNAARMENRFYFFEKITLPSFRAQTDKDYKLIIVSSDVMPDEYKQRLNNAVADIPQIEVVYSNAPNLKVELNPRIADMTAGNAEKTVHFRMDDDDAICSTMIQRLRAIRRRARKNELVSFPRGLYLTMMDGQPKIIRKFSPYIAIGWAYVSAPGQVRNPYVGMHTMAHWFVPSMLDPTLWAYIHVAHESSDSVTRQGKKRKEALEFDPDFDSEASRATIDGIVLANFPSFTSDGLRQIIAETPAG